MNVGSSDGGGAATRWCSTTVCKCFIGEGGESVVSLLSFTEGTGCGAALSLALRPLWRGELVQAALTGGVVVAVTAEGRTVPVYLDGGVVLSLTGFFEGGVRGFLEGEAEVVLEPAEIRSTPVTRVGFLVLSVFTVSTRSVDLLCNGEVPLSFVFSSTSACHAEAAGGLAGMCCSGEVVPRVEILSGTNGSSGASWTCGATSFPWVGLLLPR